uniref:MarR family winged helix-turn-helix transcriptional regulator n=1 Tax=uncultured Rhizobium sp. TaxID=155567 RepID=UPI00261A8B53|nr:MarR family winged helix-turn-helix transcriptional regulator [uncultured Rhizobium sp.]
MSINLEKDLCFVLMRFSRRLSRRVNFALRGLELTGEQVAMLDAIEAMPLPRGTDVRVALGLDPSTVSANLKPLLRQGLIVTFEDPVDHRARRLQLSPEGRRRLRLAREILLEIDSLVRGRLEERGVLKDITSALNLMWSGLDEGKRLPEKTRS